MRETIVIIGWHIYDELTEKEKEEFKMYERYKYLYEREYVAYDEATNTETEVEWEGDDCFDDMEDLLKFGGFTEMEDWDVMDVYTCCFKVFDDEEDKEYFEGLAKKAGVEGTELKIKKMKQGWYKREILLEKEDRY